MALFRLQKQLDLSLKERRIPAPRKAVLEKLKEKMRSVFSVDLNLYLSARGADVGPIDKDVSMPEGAGGKKFVSGCYGK